MREIRNPMADPRWAAAALLLALTLAGCGKPAGLVFEPLASPPRWPAPPEPPRILYVGKLETSADLKPARSFFEGLGEALFGAGDSHGLLTPYAVCTDGKGRVFVADSNAQLVHVFDLDTREYQQWQPPVQGLRFAQPVGVAYDPTGAGRLLVSDPVVGGVFAFSARGEFQRVLGVGAVKRPCGLAVDRATGRIFVADTALHQVVVLSGAGQPLTAIGRRGTALGEFNYPTNVALDRQGRLYVTDALNCRVQQFDAQLQPLRQIGKRGDLPGYFSLPKGLALDSDDHLYVLDAQFEAVQVFDGEGRLLLNFGEEGHEPGQFWLPTGIFIDAANRIWIADSYNKRIQVFDYHPEVAK